MGKNSIAQAFEDFGVLSHPDDWYFSDCLEATYPAMVAKIKASNCTEVADRLLAELQDQVTASDSEEKEHLLDWLQGLRELRDGDLRSGSERPGMNRGFVTE